MKKRVLLLIFLLMFFISFFIIVLAEEVEKDDDATKEKINEYIDVDKVKNEFGSIQGDLDDRTENVLKREVKMKEPLNKIVRLILGIRGEDSLTIEKLVMYMAFWVIFFLIIISVIAFIPNISDKKIKVGISAVVTTLVSMSGGMYYIIDLFLDFLDLITFFDKLGPARIFFGLLLLAAIVWGVKKILEQLHTKIEYQTAEDLGKNINTLGKMGKVQSEAMDKLSKDEKLM